MNAATELQEIIDTVIAEGASDLHISAGLKPMIRVSGSLVPLLKRTAYTSADTRALLNEMVNKEKQALFDSALELDFS